MKSKLIFIILLLCSCTTNKFYGHVYDYDTEEPIQNVQIDIDGNKTKTDNSGYFCMKVKSNSTCVIFLQKGGYASKKIYRKSDSLGEFSKRNLKHNIIYLLNEESDFNKN
jgi:hypothetical protein